MSNFLLYLNNLMDELFALLEQKVLFLDGH